jgi:hypothetical protein
MKASGRDDIMFRYVSEKIRQHLKGAIAYAREQRPVYVFNSDGRTVCITVDLAYANKVSIRENISIEEALKAEPITDDNEEDKKDLTMATMAEIDSIQESKKLNDIGEEFSADFAKLLKTNKAALVRAPKKVSNN